MDYTSNEWEEQMPIHAEIEYNPSCFFDEINDDNLTTPIKEEWENIEMFSSKKFSDILAKQNSRYDNNRYTDKEDSYIDIKNNQETEKIEEIEEKEDLNDESEQKSYRQSQFTDEYDDRIKKVEISDIKKVNHSRELLFEDLANSSHNHTMRSSQKSIMQRSSFKKSNDKVLTTSINLMDEDLLENEDLQEQLIDNSRTQDLRDDSLMKPPRLNFIGSNGYKNSSSKDYTDRKVFYDDLDELQSISKSPIDPPSLSQQLYQENHDQSDQKYRNDSCDINEPLNGSIQKVYENVSVFEDHDDNFIHEDEMLPESIPFNIDDDHTYDNRVQEQEVSEGGPETLKQMRMMFGSEQKIREQSQQAIQQLNNQTLEDEFQEENENLQTPSLAHSVHESSNAFSKSNVFNRKSFQEFSMKKFQELMFDNKMSDFIDSVEQSVRQNTQGGETNRQEFEDSKRSKLSYTTKRNNFVSPRKVSRKEIELDRMAGSKMKYMSEKKKQRSSMLEYSDSILLKSSGKDHLNRSMDMHKLRSENNTNRDSNSKEIVKEKTLSETNIRNNPTIEILNKHHKNVVEHQQKTEQVILAHDALDTEEDRLEDSVKRSDVRGLEVLLSEK